MRDEICCDACVRIPTDGLASVDPDFPLCSFKGDCDCHDELDAERNLPLPCEEAEKVSKA